MNASLKWMKNYIDINGDPDQMAEILTDAGIPVEHVIRPGAEISRVVTGRLLSVEKHPHADHLVICQVDIGTEQLQIVTGAPNVKPGQIVPVAEPNSHLPGGVKIKASKLRGVKSSGMLCSRQELGLDPDLFPGAEKNGIFILPETTPVGIDIHQLYDLDDVIFDFELTPNRADCFSMLGLAYEISALFGGEVRRPAVQVQEKGTPVEGRASVSLEDPHFCSRFCARLLENVKIGPSPEWMKERLRSAGIRPINNVVDTANYVMIEYGQPLHTYDYDHVAGHSLHCRHAEEGETLTTLDGEKRTLTAADLVIADQEGAVCIAGVMGGLASEVRADTSSVLLEAAVFNGASVRRTSRRIGLRSEASGRYERGVNPAQTKEALNRVCQLLSEQGACTVAPGMLDVYPSPAAAREITVSAEKINRYIGISLSEDDIAQILRRLHFSVTQSGEKLTVAVPDFRADVAGEADLCEEVARVYGYDKIPLTAPCSQVTKGVMDKETEVMMQAADMLREDGLSEAVTFSFMHKDSLKKLNYPETDRVYQAIPILNPISEEYPFVRTTLLPGLMQAVQYNLGQKNERIALFETGHVFYPKALPITELPHEELMIAAVMTGAVNEPGYPNEKRNYDFWDVKGMAEDMMAALEIKDYQIQRSQCPVFHPGKSASFVKDGKVLADFGELHPLAADNYGIHGSLFVLLCSVSVLTGFSTGEIRYEKLRKYPAVERDLAFLIPAGVSNETVTNTIRSAGGPSAETCYLFDLYEGQQIPEGWKSMAYALKFRDPKKTLTDQETDEWVANIIRHVEKLGGHLREQ